MLSSLGNLTGIKLGPDQQSAAVIAQGCGKVNGGDAVGRAEFDDPFFAEIERATL